MDVIKQFEPILGEWYAEKLIGTGSFGRVYKVYREEFGERIYSALKYISIPAEENEILQLQSDGMDDESISTYYDSMAHDLSMETKLMSRLRGNTNIVSYEYSRIVPKKSGIGYDVFIIMELLDSLTRRTVNKVLSLDEIVKLGLDLTSALIVCGKNDIIHRDIKPDNIFVSPNGDFKLGDFGIARQLERTATFMSKKGTYNYMAPEVFKGEKYGASCDFYSLGLVMYRLLNKSRLPFLPPAPNNITPADREKALSSRLRGESLPAPCDADAELSRIVLKACAFDPADRYQSAQEMYDDLFEYSYARKHGAKPVQAAATEPVKPVFEAPKQTEPVKPVFEAPKPAAPVKPVFEAPKQAEPVKPVFEAPKQAEPVKPVFEPPKQAADETVSVAHGPAKREEKADDLTKVMPKDRVPAAAPYKAKSDSKETVKAKPEQPVKSTAAAATVQSSTAKGTGVSAAPQKKAESASKNPYKAHSIANLIVRKKAASLLTGLICVASALIMAFCPIVLFTITNEAPVVSLIVSLIIIVTELNLFIIIKKRIAKIDVLQSDYDDFDKVDLAVSLSAWISALFFAIIIGGALMTGNNKVLIIIPAVVIWFCVHSCIGSNIWEAFDAANNDANRWLTIKLASAIIVLVFVLIVTFRIGLTPISKLLSSVSIIIAIGLLVAALVVHKKH